MARQDHRGTGREIYVIRILCGLAVGQEQQVVAHLPLGTITGGVEQLGVVTVRGRGCHGGGTAAIHAHGGNTAQFHHSLGQHAHGGSQAVAALAAVHGVEHHIAVSGKTHRGAGRVALGKAALDHAVVHQQVQRTDGLGNIHPVLIGGEADGEGLAGHHAPQQRQALGITGESGGENHLVLADGQSGGVLHHLVHLQQHLAADLRIAVNDGGNDADAGGGGAGGVIIAEVVGQHGHTAVFHTGLIDGSERQVLSPAGKSDLEVGTSHDSGAVGAEAHSIVVGGTGEDLPFGYQQSQGVAGGGIIEIAVDGPYYPVTLRLVGLCGSGGGNTVAYGGAVGRRCGHRIPGGVGEIVLAAKVGVVVAPIDIVTEGDAIMDLGVLEPYLLAVGVGVCPGGGGQRQYKGHRQDQGKCFLHGDLLFCLSIGYLT